MACRIGPIGQFSLPFYPVSSPSHRHATSRCYSLVAAHHRRALLDQLPSPRRRPPYPGNARPPGELKPWLGVTACGSLGRAPALAAVARIADVCWRRALAATVEGHRGGARREGRAGLPARVAGRGDDAGPQVQGKGGRLDMCRRRGGPALPGAGGEHAPRIRCRPRGLALLHSRPRGAS
jgi:hypothetical protein